MEFPPLETVNSGALTPYAAGVSSVIRAFRIQNVATLRMPNVAIGCQTRILLNLSVPAPPRVICNVPPSAGPPARNLSHFLEGAPFVHRQFVSCSGRS